MQFGTFGLSSDCDEGGAGAERDHMPDPAVAVSLGQVEVAEIKMRLSIFRGKPRKNKSRIPHTCLTLEAFELIQSQSDQPQ